MGILRVRKARKFYSSSVTPSANLSDLYLKIKQKRKKYASDLSKIKVSIAIVYPFAQGCTYSGRTVLSFRWLYIATNLFS